jgi:hypothetical protein
MRSVSLWSIAAMSLACAQHSEAPPPADEPIVAAVPAEPVIAPVEPVPEARELTVLQLPQFDGGPAYEVIVGVDGAVWYHGRGGAPRAGVDTGRVAPALVHAALRAALAAGYADDPADPDLMGGQTKFYTSVLLDRRHVVRTIPPRGHRGAYVLLTAVDDLIAKTSWDPSPRREPVDEATCPELARGIAGRCADYLKLERDAGDCPYFLDLAADLYDEPDGEVHRQRCARHRAQLLVAPPATSTAPAPRVGKKCRVWLGRNADACLASLTAGRFDRYVCYGARSQLPVFTPIVRAGPAKTSEAWCDEHTGGYAR